MSIIKTGKFLKSIFDKVYLNGIPSSYNLYERERLVAFNLQVFICVFISALFFIVGLFYLEFFLLFFTLSYVLLFSLTSYCISKNRNALSKYIYLFTTNYSVFTISYCFGYESGFYFYFLTTPLTVYITFDTSKKKLIYGALLSYLINALAMNVLFQNGLLFHKNIFPESTILILFNFNLVLAFAMIFMFIDSFMRMNKLKVEEAAVLYQKQRVLEEEIHKNQLMDIEVQAQLNKLEGEYQQLDTFNHIISHNLRGPISRVSGLLELLKQYPHASPDQHKLMEHLDASVLMIDEVVKDLNYILVQRRLGHDDSSQISLHEILEEVKLHLSEDILISGANIQEHFFVGTISCIKSIMISIFYNLISNSIKYAMPNQKPALYIIAEVKEGRLLITFKDQGIGFDYEKYGDKIFRLYSRLHSHVNGKGMGLFLVKSHVDMLDGTIMVESEPRKGTTISLDLPLRKRID